MEKKTQTARTRSLVTLTLMVGVLLGSPMAFAGVAHHVTLGSADINLVPPGGDANQSLVAIQKDDGQVMGQWHDQFGNGTYVHVSVTCLAIVGTDAWVSGPITGSNIPGAVGLPAIIRLRDNGNSQNDPEDQSSFTVIANTANDCALTPPLNLFTLNNGQVQID